MCSYVFLDLLRFNRVIFSVIGDVSILGLDIESARLVMARYINEPKD